VASFGRSSSNLYGILTKEIKNANTHYHAVNYRADRHAGGRTAIRRNRGSQLIMTENNAIEILMLVFGVLGWFLRNWNSKQEQTLSALENKHYTNEVSIKRIELAIAAVSSQSDQIKILFQRHDENALGLQKLELAIAEGHYKKGELDTKFERLDFTIRSSSDNLIKKIEEISSKFYNSNHCEKDCR